MVFGSKSVTDLIDAAQVLDSLDAQDRSIAGQVGSAKERVHVQREITKRFRSLAAAEVRTIGVRTNQVRRAARPAAGEREPARGRPRGQARRAPQRQGVEGRVPARGRRAAAGERRARLADPLGPVVVLYSPGDTTPSAAGFIWPVNGPVTSPFGWRWGRMHEGIDIGVGYGTPIHAAASGPRHLRRLDVGLREPGRDRPRPRDLDRLRPPVAARRLRRPDRLAGPDDRLRRLHRPLLRPAPALRGADQRHPVDPLGYL